MIPLSGSDDIEDLEYDLQTEERRVEDPTALNANDIDQINERLDNFEYYISHLHDRMDFLESELERQSEQNREFILSELDRLEADIKQSREENLNSVEDSLIARIEDLEIDLAQRNSEVLRKIDKLEADTQQDEIRDLSYQLDELEMVLDETREEQLTSTEVNLRLDKGLHMPLLASGIIVSGAIGISLAIMGSLFSVAALGLSMFLLLTLKKTANKHKIRLRDVL